MAERAPEFSPFGGPARWVLSLDSADVAYRYRQKCGADIRFAFGDVAQIHLYECERTGYRFWRPSEIAGDEQLYQTLAKHWKPYYRETRWEYAAASALCSRDARVLEVGCGRGYFLRLLEGKVARAEGVELNGEAVANKVTSFAVHKLALDQLTGSFDVICAFQVLEHLTEPKRFIDDCTRLLAPQGRLVLSTPNDASAVHRELADAFNLPPHHMGHFTREVFAKVADATGYRLVKTYVQPKRSSAPLLLTRAAEQSAVLKSTRYLTGLLLDGVLRALGEPGDNLLVALERAPQAS